jgi:HEAT repeat protein
MATTDQRRRVITQLNGRTLVQAFEAAKAIWQDCDMSLERPLLSTLRSGRRPFNRAAAAYAMPILKTPKIIRALERTMANKSENPRVRGYAAEALAHGHRKRSHDVLLRGLGDPSKGVRFWCAFALGEMAERRAVTVLKGLVATDKRVVRGWHSVAKEAADALNNIEAAKKDWRKGRCAFCVRD